MKKPVRILAHVVFVLSVTSIVLFILNLYNPMMGFMSSDYSLAVFLALYILSAVLAVLVFCRAGRKKSRRCDEGKTEM